MDINVSQKEWDTLAEEEKNRISAIMSGFFKDSNIVPNGAAPTPQGDIFCEIGCSAAEAAAVAACGGNPVCIAIAHAAGEACRSSC